MRSYAIIGCGGIGGYYGGLLQRAGHPTCFLLRSDWAHVRRHGLDIRSKNGNFRLRPVRACRRPEDMPPCDVAIVALKATENARLSAVLPPWVSERPCTVVLLQNGLNQEAHVAAAAPRSRVIGGLCFVCSIKAGPGLIRHLDYGRVALADYRPDRRPGVSSALRRVATDFERAGIPVACAPDLYAARWHKLMWNIPFNGLSALLLSDTRQLLALPETAELCRELMRETARGARACGAPIRPGFANAMMADTAVMKPYATSMLLDRKRKRPMEVDAIYGEPLRDAARHGCRLPRMDMLYRQLVWLDSRHASERSDRRKRIRRPIS